MNSLVKSLSIGIIDFRVVNRYVLRDSWWSKVRTWFRNPDNYYYEIRMYAYVVERFGHDCRLILELDNGVMLTVYNINYVPVFFNDNLLHRIDIKARTLGLTPENLKKYKPVKAILLTY